MGLGLQGLMEVDRKLGLAEIEKAPLGLDLVRGGDPGKSGPPENPAFGKKIGAEWSKDLRER